ncbi:MAG: response regulator [Thalassobaculaceae bacterium]|nr:response regulator [Thalassobaculaceae bacterium]
MTRKALLIIDDDPNMAALVATVAVEAGFETETLHSGARAVEVVQDLEPCGIVMDVVMPDMDGIELVRKLADSGCCVPIIMMSGYNPLYMGMAEAIATSAEGNVVARLQKPFEIEAMERALKQLDAASEPRRVGA